MVAWVQATSSAATVALGAFAELLPGTVRTDDTLELMRRSVDSLRGRPTGAPSSSGSTTDSCWTPCRPRWSCT